MAHTTSKLATKLSLEARNNEGVPWSTVEAAIELIIASVSGGIPTWDSRAFTYVGSTNNVNVVTYKLAGVSVATVTYTYVLAGVADDDDVATETLVIL